MHYHVGPFVIRSENAAKPTCQASSYLVDKLRRFAPIKRGLDMGCGKLRYTPTLAETSERLTVVDSEIQLSRKQILCGECTTVRELVMNRWNNVRALSIPEFQADRDRYDFALCANVLSAVPFNRTRLRIIREIGARLTAKGRALFVCQYTNSYFCDQMNSRQVTKYADGFIKGTPKNASFYGLIDPQQLEQLITRAGLSVLEKYRNDQSGYLTATRG